MYSVEKKMISLYIFKLIQKGNGDTMILMSDTAFQGYPFEEQKQTDTASVMVIKNETGACSFICIRLSFVSSDSVQSITVGVSEHFCTVIALKIPRLLSHGFLIDTWPSV